MSPAHPPRGGKRRGRALAALILIVPLAACGAEAKWADDASVARAFYADDGPAKISLFTVYGTRSSGGAHSGLMISGSERVFFDPAGSWWNPAAPERNDVHFGITDPMVKNYIDYHARPLFYVQVQEVVVPREVADLAAARAKAYGPVPKAFCSNSISTILKDLPGFETMSTGYFPARTAREFAKLPGVETRWYYDDDDDNTNELRVETAPLPQTGAY